MVLNRFAGWLDYPDYYLFWTLHGANSIFNIASYQNPALDTLIDTARFTEDPAVYQRSVIDFVSLAEREVPMVPIAQPTHDVRCSGRSTATSSSPAASRTFGI